LTRAKAQSTPRKIPCHFDRREKSFLDPSHSLGMTGLGPSPLRPWRPFDIAQDMLCASHSFFHLAINEESAG
jgi:hypothetical protein